MSDLRGRGGEGSELNGAQKCAIACAALGPKESGRILRSLSHGEIERVAAELMAMSPTKTEVVAAVLGELHSSQRAARSQVGRGSSELARQTLEEAVGPDQAETLLARVRARSAEAGIALIRRTTPEMLAGNLRWEHPQTAAAAIAHLDPQQAARVLGALDVDFASDVLQRIANLTPIDAELLEIVGSGLGSQAELTEGRAESPGGGADGAAKLLNLAPRSLQDKLLSALSERNADLTGKIRAKMFTFEDLLKIDSRGMQRILREVEGKELALALKGATEELKKHVKSNMSERAAESLEEEIELLGPVRARDVEAAHARILENVRRLEQDGEIIIQREGEADDVIV
jgi:flagellar motor switch protein FliG